MKPSHDHFEPQQTPEPCLHDRDPARGWWVRWRTCGCLANWGRMWGQMLHMSLLYPILWCGWKLLPTLLQETTVRLQTFEFIPFMSWNSVDRKEERILFSHVLAMHSGRAEAQEEAVGSVINIFSEFVFLEQDRKWSCGRWTGSCDDG